MNTKLGIMSGLLVAAALVGCADKSPPPQSPSSTTTNSTTTTSYAQPQANDQSYMQSPPAESTTPMFDKSSMPSAQAAIVHPETTPIDPSMQNQPALNEPEATVKPAQTAPAAAKSATDAGNSKSEIQIAAHIRKTMMASKTLSFGAKNVKVITTGNQVTLKGTVKSESERNEIVGIAHDTDGVANVNDQLTVKK